MISHTADTINWCALCGMFLAGLPFARLAQERTDSHDVSYDGASWAVKAHFCDRYHIASAFL